MCGIAGLLQRTPSRSRDELRALAAGMAASLVHRGPDDHDVWVDEVSGVALAHRRLSIVDLSPAGHQPMVSASGRYWISFNGEVYNHGELRKNLEARGLTFRGHSDTEVILASLEQWGIEATLERCVGMFAWAVWDTREHELILVRDRLGIKPLYYGWLGSDFVFASELKALRTHPAFPGTVDRGALGLFLQHGYIPAPYSIYAGVRKLLPGTVLRLQNTATEESCQPFWDLKSIARAGDSAPFRGTPAEAVNQLEECLREAVALRMLADVPVGAFLSGGIDSSTVVALMQQASSRPVRTFCIGFTEPAYNEAGYASQVARHLGTQHVEHFVTPSEALEVIPQLPELFDEPFGDSSQIPTYLVCRLARQQVTVALSGDGGDELFGGYPRYARTERVWRMLRRCPAAGRSALARLCRAAAPRAPAVVRRKLMTLAGIVGLRGLPEVYERLHSHWKQPAELVGLAQLPESLFARRDYWSTRSNVLDQLGLVDAVTYLPDDILVKVDRASMAVSLEARVPLLDHRVVEFAATLPAEYKVRDGQSKWILRQVVERHVPRRLLDRPKVGFGVPLGAWLRGPLRDWASSLLDPHRLREEGYLAPEPITAAWDDHLSGRREWGYELWDVLMFQAWLERNRR